ncbi:MAG: hypothetical protein F4145_00905 [Boseongicola sp. SB0675_bin_26]|nr:hypothetical protein [Boseongicola sp. SB0675_bin_26]
MDQPGDVKELKVGDYTFELQEDWFGRHMVSSPDLEVSIGDARIRPGVGGSWVKDGGRLEVTIKLTIELDWH